MIKNYVGLLKNEFKGYSGKKLQQDLLAGLTVAAVALPLALAFGVSSGADAAAGLVTAIIAGVVIGSLSGGFYQISGPTGAMAAILMAIFATKGLAGVLVATFIAGVLLLIAGIFRLGSLTSFIPAPVITGFTSGIAIIIALGQVDNFFGVHSEGENALAKLFSYQQLGFSPQLAALFMGCGVVLLMLVYPKKWNQVVPSSLVAIIIATVFTIFLKLDVSTVGKIPTSLISAERLQLSDLTIGNLQSLLLPAVSIAMLGMIESLLCGSSAGRMTGKDLDSNQELIAQGIGNMLLPFFGGIPATAAIARTSVAIKSGAKTRLAGVFHAFFLLLSMLLFAPIMSQIPMPALAGVLMVTAWRMNEWQTIRELFAKRYHAALILFFITMCSTVIFDLSIAIVVGIIAGCVFFVLKSATIQISVEEIDWQRLELPVLTKGEDWAVVYISGPLFFMSTNRLKQELDRLVAKKGVIFSLRGVPSVDVTALDVFADYAAVARYQKQELIFTSMQPEVARQFEQLWNEEKESQPQIHPTVAHALTAMHQEETPA